MTIPGVNYVIDSGFVKIKHFDVRRNVESLMVIPVSKASAL